MFLISIRSWGHLAGFLLPSGAEGSCDGSLGMIPLREGDRGEIRLVQFNSGWEQCSALS